MTNVILCGGNGTRLWPISRTLMPKQFVKLFDEKSLYQLTVDRNSRFCQNSFIVSNMEQYFLAKDQLEELHGKSKEHSNFLLEPIGRNTAPAIALACMALQEDETVLVTPSDHLIKNEDEYAKVLYKAKELAEDGYLVTFGIKPTFAETGFGYIEADGTDVKAFHEKPDFATASKYLEAGNYYWNSGMFCFKAGVFLDELKKYSPQIYDTCKAALKDDVKTSVSDNTIKIKKDDMLEIPEDSIDYAVMEKSSKVKVVPSDIGWSDVGSFDALYEELPKDENGNTVNKNYVQIESKNNFIYGCERKIATVDIEDLIVVDTGDALLISKKGSSQKVKNIVNKIRNDSQLHNIHLTAHRPWGTYTILEDNPKYKIKRIEVKPGGRLSLQKHFHRSEHWTVVSGTAVVTLGEKEIPLRANESIHIPMGELHRLENCGKLNLVIIETQIGDYLGEDDIVRVEDDYKRS
ncbi:MAG: mannose-1-phosphate guanylyltransferase/mannose-6-phosphate isomerase [Sulfurimonas sp. RIFOXYD12_FULL_33_39]|uniref:mannose-1-phosphate guanylyltransferase/mannose-6-phosphate isomerase n=1 Tax=unclassified Sulfurimonas TaxID=2623549 RepID=UPI0008BB1AAA|nr:MULTISPECIES: mannose-1-phosphate guanylyltransferase/mannose-6-phosphate isomerase [unclassified Sulfurimonas]OHE10572.1 MAG: mannose-1-phosphate guanylyltransferase/mannose-6-phosphate isomerase [Sulfurimonas sp. RIFOXYD12_FULL_33_39]OHE15031.1 MAG: mannose-1-phosphate guanylyltransferase/mannose-6-phosphate isomerase [Sulfurimonas sp. RIFOXYD2_FULL_34_21]DAB28536.1 MAG TPA: mannose-1-phosphate guanylyltransferase/mannose-6-phosphate isomerase [Sulfurimonas sp. UBA10385]